MKIVDGYIYKCIKGINIGSIYQENTNFFWTKSYTEQQYKDFVKASQDFFDKFIRVEDCRGYKIDGSDAYYVYINLGNCIMGQEVNGIFICGSNGRHRCAVAKKYNLNLLVCLGKEFH